MSNHHTLWVGLRVRQYRRNRGLTQAQLALAISDQLGGESCHQSSVSHWEHGRAEVSLRFRRPLAEVLEVPVDILFEDPPPGWQPARTAA